MQTPSWEIILFLVNALLALACFLVLYMMRQQEKRTNELREDINRLYKLNSGLSDRQQQAELETKNCEIRLIKMIEERN